MDNEVADFLEELVQGPKIGMDMYQWEYYIRQVAKRLLANRAIETDNQLSRATLYHEESCVGEE